MLYLKRIIDTNYINTPTRRVLVAVLFVNPIGKASRQYIIDLLNEFLNLHIKEAWARRYTSTSSFKDIIEYYTLNDIFFYNLYYSMLKLQGRIPSGRYLPTPRDKDITTIARLLRDSITYIPGRSLVDWKLIVDTYTISRDKLLVRKGSKLAKFNKRNIGFLYLDNNSITTINGEAVVTQELDRYDIDDLNEALQDGQSQLGTSINFYKLLRKTIT